LETIVSSSPTGDADGARRAEGVGTVGEEATKLFQVLQDWTRDSGSERAAGAASGAASALHDIGEHVATGGADCRYCPVCRVIGVVRGTSPEVRQHLATAATALVSAAAGLLDTPVPDRSPDEAAPAPPEQPGPPEEAVEDGWEDDSWG
jgi:hypothetical protein